jgi:Antirepressor regulating drug resistance, predicted signal transduction N-terminal membrane component
MNNAIMTILSLSASGSVLALILLALRPLLKNRVSKTFQYYIWLLVLLRLALPLSFDGSIMNRIIPQTVMAQAPAVSTLDDGNGITQGDNIPQGNEQNTPWEVTPSESAMNGNAVPDSNLPAASEPARFNIWKFALDHLTAIWLLGAALYFGWFVIVYLRFSRKIRKTGIRPHAQDMEVYAKLRGNARVQLSCDPYINTPMLIGFLSPCIVIPHLAFAVNGMESELGHILRHELTHYRRRDLLYKWFAVLVSSLHWFNPLMILVRREISRTCELSCDEAVIRSLDAALRQDYGETLLAIASNKRLPSGIVTTTMCEGKRELKERLESIMTYQNKSVFMVALSLVLALLLAGCSVALGAANVTGQISDEEASQSPAATDTPGVSTIPDDEASQFPATADTPGVPTSPSAADHSVLEAYHAVLQNQAEFFSTDNQKNLYLNDFLTNKEIYETIFSVTHFTVLDLDGDQAPEVVLELSVGGNPQFYEVLHDMNDTIYGYLIVYRGLTELKADGTFLFSSGAADNGAGKLKFESDAYMTDPLAYSQSSQGDTTLTITYFINNEQVTKEAFDSFVNEQSGKKDAVWYEFSQQNIETELSANP